MLVRNIEAKRNLFLTFLAKVNLMSRRNIWLTNAKGKKSFLNCYDLFKISTGYDLLKVKLYKYSKAFWGLRASFLWANHFKIDSFVKMVQNHFFRHKFWNTRPNETKKRLYGFRVTLLPVLRIVWGAPKINNFLNLEFFPS